MIYVCWMRPLFHILLLCSVICMSAGVLKAQDNTRPGVQTENVVLLETAKAINYEVCIAGELSVPTVAITGTSDSPQNVIEEKEAPALHERMQHYPIYNKQGDTYRWYCKQDESIPIRAAVISKAPLARSRLKS